MKCSDCRFYRSGECRLSPPVRLPRRFDASASAGCRIRSEELIWGWPLTGPDNWCGQFALAIPAKADAEVGVREILSELPEYLECLESDLIGLDVDMKLNDIIPPGVWADRVRAALANLPAKTERE